MAGPSLERDCYYHSLKHGTVGPSLGNGRVGPSLENGRDGHSLESGRGGHSLESVREASCCSPLARDRRAGRAGGRTACWIHLGKGTGESLFMSPWLVARWLQAPIYNCYQEDGKDLNTV